MKHWLLVDKYAPQTIQECILPKDIKAIFQGFIDTETIPNLLLTGSSGKGKTTAIRCLAEQLNCDFVIINGSKERGIDNVRYDIEQYVSSISFKDKRKILLIDEADGLTVDAQQALRGQIEEFQNNCSFVFTCNYPEKIIDAIKSSRTCVINFNSPKEEKAELCKELLIRLKFILEQEGIAYTDIDLVNIIKAYYPDIRRVINEVQKFSTNTEKKLIVKINHTDYNKLVPILKGKNFVKLRKWIAENFEFGQFPNLLQELWENIDTIVEPKEVPTFIMISSDYQDRYSRSINQEIHLIAFLLELSSQLTFK